MCQPESATIIIELKRLFNNRAEYNFVQNHYQPAQEEEDGKRDEQIFSTAHTNFNERPISTTHALFLRNKSGKCHTAHSK
jgi:hypothetical protein